MARGSDHSSFLCEREEQDMIGDVRRIISGHGGTVVCCSEGYLFSSMRVRKMLARILSCRRALTAAEKTGDIVVFRSPDPEIPLPTIFAMAHAIAINANGYTGSLQKEMRRLLLMPLPRLHAEVACFTLAESQ